ncbi:FkbM family methyltransferase [Candidatus Pacearchaeota archaeon]|jgi:hypothetical protein|nr:FkbM family methyltransferase [Candidatus Pacearchaeota archaeon]
MEIPDDMKQFFSNGEYCEKNVYYHLQRLVDCNSVFYDIGANYGYYSVRLAGVCKQIYSFEPVTKTFSVLCENTSNFPNVKPIKLGLFNEFGEHEINLYNVSGCNSLFRRNVNVLRYVGVENIQLDTLDHVIDYLNLLPPTIIKMDVEGVEKHILQGASNTLTHKPVLLLEYGITTANDSGYDVSDILEILTGYGYKIQSLSGDNDLFLYDQIDTSTTNILAT